jgi:hypothetical protein
MRLFLGGPFHLHRADRIFAPGYTPIGLRWATWLGGMGRFTPAKVIGGPEESASFGVPEGMPERFHRVGFRRFLEDGQLMIEFTRHDYRRLPGAVYRWEGDEVVHVDGLRSWWA